MTIRGTNAYAVQAELVTRWTARAGLSGVPVLDAVPDNVMETEAVWFRDISATTENIAMRPSGGLIEVSETIDFEVFVQSLEHDTAAAAKARVAALLGEVFEEVMGDPTLSGNVTGLLVVYPDRWDLNHGRLPGGTRYAAAVELHLTAESLIKSTTA